MPRSLPRPATTFALIGAAAVLCGVALCPAPAGAQSFDCHKAYFADEKAICEQQALGALDEQLSRRYGQARSKLDKEDRDAFDQHETLFVISRRRCGANPHCIEQSYRNRIRELEDMLSPSRDVSENDSAKDRDTDRKHRRSERQGSAPAEPDTTAAAKPEHAGPEHAKPEHADPEHANPEHAAPTAIEIPSRQAAERARRQHSTQRQAKSKAPAPVSLTPPAEPQSVEHTGTSIEAAAPRPEHRPRLRRKHETAATGPVPEPAATSAPAAASPPAPESPPASAGATGSSAATAKPAIRWVDPPPGR